MVSAYNHRFHHLVRHHLRNNNNHNNDNDVEVLANQNLGKEAIVLNRIFRLREQHQRWPNTQGEKPGKGSEFESG